MSELKVTVPISYIDKLQTTIATLEQELFVTRTQSQWISVDSCLPEYKGMYLTFWTDGSLETYNFSKERGDLGWYQPLSNQQITHWANLPLPPKEQGQ